MTIRQCKENSLSVWRLAPAKSLKFVDWSYHKRSTRHCAAEAMQNKDCLTMWLLLIRSGTTERLQKGDKWEQCDGVHRSEQARFSTWCNACMLLYEDIMFWIILTPELKNRSGFFYFPQHYLLTSVLNMLPVYPFGGQENKDVTGVRFQEDSTFRIR